MNIVKRSNKFGFSLIELSVVILVIGILVTGVTQGSRIIKASKLKSAQALTKGSPVASTNDLILWLDGTSESSFVDSDKVDGQAISSNGWLDINPQVTTKNNATLGAFSPPIYTANAINGLPALSFDSAGGRYLVYNGSPLVSGDYTIFVVEQRRLASAGNFIGGNSGCSNCALVLGYSASTSLLYSQFGNDYTITVPSYGSPISRIHSVTLNSGNASAYRTYYINAIQQTLSPAPNAAQMASYSPAWIGRNGGGNYTGYIGEVVIFNRALKNTERQNIENYLSQKWGIDIN